MSGMKRLAKRLLPFCLIPLLLVSGLNGRAYAEGNGDSEEAQGEILLAVVGYVVEQSETVVLGHRQAQQELELVISSGARRGEVITMQHVTHPAAGRGLYKVGDRVYVQETQGEEGYSSYYIVGYARSSTLLWMFLVFVALVILVGRQVGARSLLGMAVSFAIIFAFILPRIFKGDAPVGVVLLGAALAMPVSYYLAHGLNRKTTVALVGSFLGLVLTALLALLCVDATHLTGFASDEAGFLQSIRPGEIDIRGLLLAGMVIGVLGVLDDITVAQAAIVEQLRAADSSLAWRQLYARAMRVQLYARAMRVGQDHIASMVNTLMLVYAGAALPLLLLLSDRSLPLAYVLSHEVIAEEAVRVLVTSIGLVAAVPITTLLASLAMGKHEMPRAVGGDRRSAR